MDFDTEMAVFTGACGSAGYVGCNDDYTGTGQCSNTLRSRITWTATQGNDLPHLGRKLWCYFGYRKPSAERDRPG
ncbi:MAG: hypothetical protein IPG92_09850 [Flavobacteriales bacterium]|nr:hypothetical protein [Flavobacteriales bacterium]